MLTWIKEHLKLVIVAGAVLGSIGFVIGIKIADQPFFCGLACHEMQPHVDTRAANFHGKNGVVCMDCHSKQGFWHHAEEHIVSSWFVVPHITKVYLEDEHDIHANVEGFDKEAWSFRGKVGTPAEKEIFKECKKCHPNRLETSYYMKVPEEKHELISNNCKRCHSAIASQAEEDTEAAKAALYKEGIKAPRGLPNVHPLHLGMDILCVKCHSRVVHSTDPSRHTPGMERCVRCHNGEDAPFDDCKMCHIGIKKIFAGNSAKGIEETESPMVDIECLECHNAKKYYKVSGQTCAECHDDESYARKIPELQGIYNEKFALATKAHDKAQAGLERARRHGKDVSAIISVFKEGEYNYKLAGLDGSHGVHNPEFTAAVLDRVVETFNEVNNMIEATVQQ